MPVTAPVITPPFAAAIRVMPVIIGKLREDHTTGLRLKHARDRDLDRVAQTALAVVHHDHGPVIEIRHALLLLLAFLEDLDFHLFPRHDHGFQRIGEIVNIEDFRTLYRMLQIMSG